MILQPKKVMIVSVNAKKIFPVPLYIFIQAGNDETGKSKSYCPSWYLPFIEYLIIVLYCIDSYRNHVNRRHNSHCGVKYACSVYNTPVIIKYPFWQMTAANEKAEYACLNYGEALTPLPIKERSICIDGDISEVLRQL